MSTPVFNAQDFWASFWPLPSGRFDAAPQLSLPTIGAPMTIGGFVSIAGLGVTRETTTVPEGAKSESNAFASPSAPATLTLTRSVGLDRGLWTWFDGALDDLGDELGRRTPVARDGIVLLLSKPTDALAPALPFGPRVAVAAWYIRDATPMALSGPELDARGSGPALESVQLRCGSVARLGASLFAPFATLPF